MREQRFSVRKYERHRGYSFYAIHDRQKGRHTGEFPNNEIGRRDAQDTAKEMNRDRLQWCLR